MSSQQSENIKRVIILARGQDIKSQIREGFEKKKKRRKKREEKKAPLLLIIFPRRKNHQLFFEDYNISEQT